MKWIGQHIYDLVSRFRDDVYLEDLSTTTSPLGHAILVVDAAGKVSKNTGVSGDLTSIVAGTGLSGTSLTGPIPTLNVDASQPGITTLAGVSAIGTASTPIVITSDAVTLTSANSQKPFFELKSTTNDNKSSVLQFTKDKGAAGADADFIGIIDFISDDAAQTQMRFAQITAQIKNADDTDESGKLTFSVAESDGTNTQLTAGLVLQGEHATDGEVDVTIAAGAASTTTIAGTLTMGSTAAMTNAGLLTVANQENITGLGTISDGVWNGAAIGASYVATLNQNTTGEAGTVETIAGLAPNTATTQATQPAIRSIGTDGTTLGILSDQLEMSNATASMPTVKLTNTTDDDACSELVFEKLRDDDAVAQGQNLGAIWFKGQDSGQNTEDYAYIIGEIDVSTHPQESGSLSLGVANHDGGNGTGLKLTGGSADNEIDVTIGLGGSSVTTIAGTLTIGDVAAMTNAGLLRVPNQSNITGVGTISSGVWQGTTIKTAYIGDDQVTEDKLANTLLAEIDANTAKVTRHTLIDSDVMTGASSSNVASAESIKAYVDSKYATSYMAFLCDTDAFVNNQYITVSGNGISNHAWNVDTDLDHTDTNARTINHADAHISTNGLLLTASILIPQACQLMGFYAVGRNEVTDTAFGFGIFVTAEANANWGSASNNATGGNTILRAYGISANDDNEKKHQKIDGMLDTPFDLGEGDLITPAAWGPTGDQVKGTITLVLRTLIQ